MASAIPHPSGLVVNAENSIEVVLAAGACLVLAVAAIALIGITNRLTHHNYWSHEHFTGATLAQFFYVAAQCGIFSFLINYVASDSPRCRLRGSKRAANGSSSERPSPAPTSRTYPWPRN